MKPRVFLLAAFLLTNCGEPPRLRATGRSVSLEQRVASYLAIAEASSRSLDSPQDHEKARQTYNKAATDLVTLLRSAEGTHLWNQQARSFKTYRLRYALSDRSGVWNPDYFTSFFPSNAVDLKKLRPNRHSGIGGALVGVRNMNPPEPQTPPLPGVSAPVTALLDFKGHDATLTLVNPTEKSRFQVAGINRELEADFAAPLAYYPNQAETWNGVMGALRVEKHMDKTGLFMMQPYDPDRIPLIFVHGLISTPQMWRSVINELERDPVIRARYQCWVFRYPTGNPPAYSAMRLREELATARRLHPGMKRYLLVGHSMGGILSRMQATTVTRKDWDVIGKNQAAAFFAKATPGSLIERASIFKADPHVARIVFICSPHRGSEMATGPLGNIGRGLIKLPTTLVAAATGQMGDTLSVLTGNAKQLPNSVTGLSPRNPMLKVIDAKPVDAPYHSIIGDRGKGDSPLSSDGVVPYWSSHLPRPVSEHVVPGPHGACELPQTIAELRRILRVHANQPIIDP
ncbi:MAG TPA: alpha/beta fold hydrolase [Luteolibacter sp.]